MSEKQSSNVAQLPDGWEMYDKYQIRHTDGTPLKGKKYFVLRLDSDNPAEAARVAAAMRAYKGELSDGNGAKMREALIKFVRAYEQTDEMANIEDTAGAYDLARAALSAPPRNCDVGTAEEQTERMHENYCSHHECYVIPTDAEPYGCPLYEQGVDCRLKWAQMPYEEGGAK
ncbi:MAG: hypothetical protein II823_06870 [Kiritimatiellae bacterium]|nr:hypothetical protein [Kiritimatiellia bacterium]